MEGSPPPGAAKIFFRIGDSDAPSAMIMTARRCGRTRSAGPLRSLSIGVMGSERFDAAGRPFGRRSLHTLSTEERS